MEDYYLRGEIDGVLAALDNSKEVITLTAAILDESKTLTIGSILLHVAHSGGLSSLTSSGQENLLSLLLSRKDYQVSHDIDTLLIPYLSLDRPHVQFVCLTMAMSVLKTWEREMSKSLLMHDRVMQARRVIGATEDRLVQVGENTFKTYEGSLGRPLGAVQKRPLRAVDSDLHMGKELSLAESGEIAAAIERVQAFTETRGVVAPGAGASGESPKRPRVDDSSHFPQGAPGAEPSSTLSQALSKSTALGVQVRKMSSGRHGSLSDRQIKASAADAVDVVVSVSELSAPVEQIRCMATACLWQAPEELLEVVARSLVVHERLSGSAVVCYLQGALLPKLRCSSVAASSRLFARSVECIAKKRIDMVVHCLLARSLCSWPVPTFLTESLCRALSLTDKDAAAVEKPDVNRKPPYELALRVGRSFPESVGDMISGLCLCEGESSSLRQKELILSQALDAALSPLSVLGASYRGKMAAKGPAALSADKLSLLASDVWKPYVDTLSSSSSSVACLTPPPRGYFNPELLKTVSSLTLLAPPGSLGSGMLCKLMQMLQNASGEVPGSGKPWFAALGAVLLAFASRHHKVASNQEAREAAEKLIQSCGARLLNGTQISKMLNT